MKRNIYRIVGTFALVSLFLPAFSKESGTIPLVKDGKATSVIILDENAVKAAKFAAAELQYHLKLMTGATIPIVTDESKTNGTKIYVGESEATRKMGLKSSEFSEQEYLARVKDDHIILLGRDSSDHGDFKYGLFRTHPNKFSQIGTCYAVYDFLWALGFRWYLPTETGIVYDETKNLFIPEMNIRRKPYMVSRGSAWDPPIPKDFNGSAKQPMKEFISPLEVSLFYLRLKAGGENENINHSFVFWYDRFGKSHPDYLAKGYPLKPDVTQPCCTNPDVIAQVVQDAREYFNGDPEPWKKTSSISKLPYRSSCFPVVLNDNRQFCKCENCAKMILSKPKRECGFNDKASDYWFTFINAVAKEVAKTHPDKTIGTLAYMQNAYPPATFRLEPNIKVRICLGPRTWDPSDTTPELLKVWKKEYPKMKKSLHLYYLEPYYLLSPRGTESFPAFFADYIGAQFKVYADSGVNSFFYEPAQRGKGEAFLDDQLECFLTYKLADDPTANASALIDEFFARYYGKAGNSMKKLYRAIEKASFDAASKKLNCSLEELQWGVMGSTANMKKFAVLMEEAKRIAAQDKEIYRKRVQIFEKGLWDKIVSGHKAYVELGPKLSATMKQVSAFRVAAPQNEDPKNIDWKNVTPLREWRTRQGEKTDRDITLKVVHDGKNLYMLLEDPVETAKLTNRSTWGDGCEFFFGHKRNFPYYYLGIGHDGEVQKLYFEVLYQSSEWKTKVKIKSELQDPKCWRLYVALPLDSIGLKPEQMLYFNVLRGRNNKTEACWIPTFGGNHEPSRFGEIWLEK